MRLAATESLRLVALLVALAPATAVGQIYHFSSAGDDADVGSPAAPKRTLAHAASLMAPGVTLRFRRGDAWYEGKTGLLIEGLQGTAQAPVVLEAYGSGPLPIIAAMFLFDTDWRDEGGGLWSHVGSSLQTCFLDGRRLKKVMLTDLDAADEFAVDAGRVYLFGHGNPAQKTVEAASGVADEALTISNSEHVTVRELSLRGGDTGTVMVIAPTAHVVFERVEIRRCSHGALSFAPGAQGTVHLQPVVRESLLDKDWETYLNSPDYLNVDMEPTGDGISFAGAVEGGRIEDNELVDFGHTAIKMEAINSGHYGVHNCVVTRNVVRLETSNYCRALSVLGYEGRSTKNVISRNLFYEMSQSSKLGGNDNLFVANVIWRLHPGVPAGSKTGGGINGLQLQAPPLDPLRVARGNRIVHNTFVDFDRAGLYVHAGSEVNEIRNNLFVRPSRFAYEAATGASAQIVTNNGVWLASSTDALIRIDGVSYTVAEADATSATFSDNLQEPPAFVDAPHGDFRLKPTSPYRAAGVNVVRPGEVLVDMDGQPWDPMTPSVGAYQYRAAPPDAGVPTHDAGVPDADAPTPPPDTGGRDSRSDASEINDLASPGDVTIADIRVDVPVVTNDAAPDGSGSAADAGQQPRTSAGCSCQTSAPSSLGLVLLLLALTRRRAAN